MIKEVLYTFHNDSANIENHRFRSWEHCYSYFREHRTDMNDEVIIDHASLHLAFYLASWGMLRNSFLLQRDYHVHKKFIREVVAKTEYSSLLDGRALNLLNTKDVELLNSLIEETNTAYLPVLNEVNGHSTKYTKISDTLTSKILLGVFGVLPAYDRFFKEAAGFHGINKKFNENSFGQLQSFYDQFKEEFDCFIAETAKDTIRYTPMKVLDMYFWKIGDILTNGKDIEQKERLIAFISHIKPEPVKLSTNLGPKTGNKTDAMRHYIAMYLQSEKAMGQDSAIVCARDIHNAFNLSNSYPSVCNAMGSVPGYERYEVVYAPKSGKSSTVTYRYWFGKERDSRLLEGNLELSDIG